VGGMYGRAHSARPEQWVRRPLDGPSRIGPSKRGVSWWNIRA